MGRKDINIEKYVSEVKRNMDLAIADDIIEKDLLLTLILAEFQKQEGVFTELIFKGGTLLSRNYLKYHRFSEDLDFVHKDSNEIRLLSRHPRERAIKKIIDSFVPELKKVAESLNLDFSINRSDQKYCTIISSRAVYIFRLYYNEKRYIKIEINFIEEIINKPIKLSIRTITDFFDSRELLFILGLKIDNFNVLSYTIDEIVIEKYRALLTRDMLAERDLFDLYLIPESLKVDIKNIVKKIRASSLIKKDIISRIEAKFKELNENRFFKSTENISDLAIIKYSPSDFTQFKDKIRPILIKICKEFLRS